MALLLPYHDIKIIVFGGVEPLLEKAKKKPKSLFAKSSPTDPIFRYEAPKESGSSTLCIFLHKAPSWTPADATAAHSPYKSKPDAILGPNAGLAAYPAWHPVIVWTLATNTPFGVTDYSEQSCETQRMRFIPLLSQQAMSPGSVCSGPGAPNTEQCRNVFVAIRSEPEFPIELNPFQRPGQRPIPFRLPNVPNGFTQRVVWQGP